VLKWQKWHKRLTTLTPGTCFRCRPSVLTLLATYCILSNNCAASLCTAPFTASNSPGMKRRPLGTPVSRCMQQKQVASTYHWYSLHAERCNVQQLGHNVQSAWHKLLTQTHTCTVGHSTTTHSLIPCFVSLSNKQTQALRSCLVLSWVNKPCSHLLATFRNCKLPLSAPCFLSALHAAASCLSGATSSPANTRKVQEKSKGTS